MFPCDDGFNLGSTESHATEKRTGECVKTTQLREKSRAKPHLQAGNGSALFELRGKMMKNS